MAKGISLSLGSAAPRRTTTVAFWIRLSDLINMQRNLQEKGKNIERIIARDRRVFSAVETLLQARKTIVKYGASESIMSVFNEGNQLADVIGCAIPTVSAINQRSVGQMCVEGIDAVVENAEGKVCEFFDELVKGIAEYIEQLRKTAECQKATLEGLNNDLLANIEAIDASGFGQDEVFGYAAPVFNERLAAIRTICEAFKSQDVCAALHSCAAPLEMLGYKVEKKVDVVEETPEEAAAAAPAPEEVMSPPIAEPPAAPASQEDLEAAPQREEAVPAIEVPADAPQEQEVAVLRWTPASIKDAVINLIAVLGSVEGLYGAGDVVAKIKETACAEGCEDVDAKRTLAASIGTIVRVVGGAVSELFDQIVAMCAKLKKAEVPASAPEATPVAEVTEAAPLGDRCGAKRRRRKARRAKNEFEGGDVTEHEFEPEKQMEEQAGELSDDEEGPIEEENAPQARRRRKKTRRTRNEFEGGDVTEHEFDPEEQMEEQAGEMEDDEEGPIKEEDVPHAGTPESAAPGEGSKASDEYGWFYDEDEVPAEPADAPVHEEPIGEEPVTTPEVPAEPAEVPPQPVAPVNPDGTPIVEEPITPPQPIAEEPVSDRWFFDEDADNSENMGDPAGALEEDTEGPVEEEPAPSAGTPDGVEAGEGSKTEDSYGWFFDEDNVEEPEGLGELSAAEPEPLDEPAKGVDPNGDPDIPDMVTEPHIEPVETPPTEIPEEKAEELITDTRFSFL